MQFIAMVLIGGAGHDLRRDPGRLLHHAAPRLTRELPDVLPFISCSPTETPNVFQLADGPLRRADHRVPHLRTTGTVRHLDADPQLLESLAVLVLTARTTDHLQEDNRT